MPNALRHIMRRACVLLVLATVACATPPLPRSENHVSQSSPPPSGTIPSPVQVPANLPRPKVIQKPETYSVVVNNVLVQELLFALARDAKLNIDIQSGIKGTVTMNAIDQTLPQLLTRIARQADIRWELNGPNLSVMPDSPYLHIYRVDYLNMERTSTSTVSVSGNVGGAGGGGGNASTSTVTNRVDSQFWKVLIDNIKSLLQETDKVLPAGAAPAATAPQAPPAAAAQGQPAPPASAGSAPSTPSATFREAASGHL